MEPITFEDTLIHYKIKISEALDYLSGISSQLDREIDCVNTSWSGRSAESCRVKLEDLKLELEKAQLSLQQADAGVSEVLATQQAII